MAVQATYKLSVDWDNDGSFATAGDDITADMIRASIRRGYSRPLARVPKVGRATFVLRNAAQTYSPAADATVLPRRPVKFEMTYSSTVTLFTGYVESITPDYGSKLRRQCVLECVDSMAILDSFEGEIALQEHVYADDIITAVINRVWATPPATSLQTGLNVFEWSADRWDYGPLRASALWEKPPSEEIRATDKILAACTADWGRFFVAKDGTLTYYNRHQMPTDASTDLTLNDDMVDLFYRKSVDEIFNNIEVTCYPRVISPSIEVLGRIDQDDAPSIDGSATKVFVIHFRDPSNPTRRMGGYQVVDPLVASSDYSATDDPAGEGTDKTAQVTPALTVYGDRAEVSCVNADAATVYIQKLQVRGRGVRVREPVTMVATDATSVTAYQNRKLPINALLMDNQRDAENLADFLLDYYKDPTGEARGLAFVANKDATFMAAARDLELMNRIVVTETQTGLSGYVGFAYWVQHDIDSKWYHRVTLDLETAYTYTGDPIIIDTSTIDGADVIYY